MLLTGALYFGVLLQVSSSTLVSQSSGMETFKQCLISTPISLGHCLGMGALTKLQSIDNNPEFNFVDGVSFTRDDQQVRESYNFMERDPGDFRTIVDSVGQVFSRRNLKWDMGFVYPGLLMRVAPSASPGGVLEFVMDPHREALSQHTLKEAGTARLMTRQFLLPFLLGFKFNVATLIPIIFGLLALIAKKAIFLSKVGLIISSAVGLGTLLFGTRFPQQGGGFNPGFGGGGGTGGGGGSYGHAPHVPYRFPDDEHYYPEHFYRGYNDERVFNEVQPANTRDDKNGRNFAWNEAEKKENT